MTIDELRGFSDDELLARGFRRWDETMWLIPLDKWHEFPEGTEVCCIDGTTAIKGKDYIDTDTRGGMIAYGWQSRTAG